MNQQSQSKSVADAELYKQACDDHRFYADMRFKQLSLFGVVSGLLLNTLNKANTPQMIATVSSVGMIVTNVIWIMEVRSSIYAQIARSRKHSFELEFSTQEPQRGGLTQGKPATISELELKWTHFNATNAVLVLYMISYFSWLILFFSQANSTALRAFGSLLGFLFSILVAFSIRQYGSLLRHGQKTWKW